MVIIKDKYLETFDNINEFVLKYLKPIKIYFKEDLKDVVGKDVESITERLLEIYDTYSIIEKFYEKGKKRYYIVEQSEDETTWYKVYEVLD